jgi:hypothetical protein
MIDLPSAVARPFHMSWSIDDTAAFLDLKNSRPSRSRAHDVSLGINRDSGQAPTPEEVAIAKQEMEACFATHYRPIHAKLEDAVASHLLHLVEIGRLVIPGKYHLYFAGDTEVFEEKFHSPDADLSGFSRPMFTLSPVELELAPKPAPCSGSPRI